MITLIVDNDPDVASGDADDDGDDGVYTRNGDEDADDSDSVAYGEYMGADEDCFWFKYELYDGDAEYMVDVELCMAYYVNLHYTVMHGMASCCR